MYSMKVIFVSMNPYKHLSNMLSVVELIISNEDSEG